MQALHCYAIIVCCPFVAHLLPVFHLYVAHMLLIACCPCIWCGGVYGLIQLAENQLRVTACSDGPLALSLDLQAALP